MLCSYGKTHRAEAGTDQRPRVLSAMHLALAGAEQQGDRCKYPLLRIRTQLRQVPTQGVSGRKPMNFSQISRSAQHIDSVWLL